MDPNLRAQWDAFAKADLERAKEAPVPAPTDQEEARARARGLVPAWQGNGVVGRLMIDPCTGKPPKETYIGPPSPKPLPRPENPIDFDGAYVNVKVGPIDVTGDTTRGWSLKTQWKKLSEYRQVRAVVGACVAPRNRPKHLSGWGIKGNTGLVHGSIDLDGRGCLGIGPGTPNLDVKYPGAPLPGQIPE